MWVVYVDQCDVSGFFCLMLMISVLFGSICIEFCVIWLWYLYRLNCIGFVLVEFWINVCMFSLSMLNIFMLLFFIYMQFGVLICGCFGVVVFVVCWNVRCKLLCLIVVWLSLLFSMGGGNMVYWLSMSVLLCSFVLCWCNGVSDVSLMLSECSNVVCGMLSIDICDGLKVRCWLLSIVSEFFMLVGSQIFGM